MGVSDFRCFGAAETAVWPAGRAGTAAPSGWTWGPELTLTRHQSDRPGVPTCEITKRQDACMRSELEIRGPRHGLKFPYCEASSGGFGIIAHAESD
eukprot:13699639-Alexandrium_andersonii.AAC.1